VRRYSLIRFIAFVNIFLCFGITSCHTNSGGQDTTSGDIELFLSSLQGRGFDVQEGKYLLVDAIDLVNRGIINTANGNNSGNPYYAYILPLAPGQSYPNEVALEGGYLNYRLKANEALILVGATPPETMYFSYRSFLFSRYYSDLGRQFKLYTALGDTLNKLTISTGRTAPFNRPIMIITSGDQTTHEMVKSVAIAAGYPPAIINIDILPSEILKMGLDKEDDTFTFLGRTAMPIDNEGFAAYLTKSGSRVFRITPRDGLITGAKPYPKPTLKPRGTGQTEAWLQPGMNDLREAILAHYSAYEATELTTEIWLPESLVAIDERRDVLGESRDTPYLWTNLASKFVLPDDPNEFLIVYGVNHQASGKATYSNFIVYGEKYINGVASVASPSFSGSADVYIQGHSQANYLYAWKVARQSDGSAHCLTVPYGPQHYGFGSTIDDQYGFVGFRAYLEPATTVGAKWDELLYDRVIKFKKR
jgi:hypothetical protein